MNPTQAQSGVIPDQLQQAQMQQQASQGLGTPPPPPFEYKENPSMALMSAHIANQQQALAAKMAAEQNPQGYAGYKGDPTAGVQTGSVQGDQSHPNAGWTPASPEVHNLNVQLADRIKSGSIDPRTAMIALQHPDVAPEVKQALSQIVQQVQNGAAPSEPQGAVGSPVNMASAGLGSVGIPQ